MLSVARAVCAGVGYPRGRRRRPGVSASGVNGSAPTQAGATELLGDSLAEERTREVLVSLRPWPTVQG